MNGAALHWFLHDSCTARALKRLASNRAFADCPVANVGIAATLVIGCYAVAMCVSGHW